MIRIPLFRALPLLVLLCLASSIAACGVLPEATAETTSDLVTHVIDCSTSPRALGLDLPAADVFSGLSPYTGACRRIIGDVNQGYASPGYAYQVPAGDSFVIHSVRLYQAPVVPTTTPPGYAYVCDMSGMSFPGCARTISFLSTSPGSSYPKQVAGISGKGVVVGYTALSPAPQACPTSAVSATACGTMSPWGLPNYVGTDATSHNVAQTFSPCTAAVAGVGSAAFNFTCDQALD